MEIDELQREFYKLCEKSEQAYNEELEVSYEHTLVNALVFLKRYEGSRREIAEILNRGITENTVPLELIAFCMRELRWEEVRDHAILIYKASLDPRRVALLTVIKAYDAFWPDEDQYAYFGRRGV
ncbi:MULTISPECIES: hypothetical protein [Pseudomonadaceae]|uniref:hypothetical protein n=1 Tax=Pseudomonadaceae TaxID=135621 RepID=UPI0011513ED9|nr:MULTISPECIES: hypothetical protein [Pseudomonas]MCP1618578.1 hypothetical protein [Pseudomonas otitidis]